MALVTVPLGSEKCLVHYMPGEALASKLLSQCFSSTHLHRCMSWALGQGSSQKAALQPLTLLPQ